MSTDTRLVFNQLNGRLDAFLATSRMEVRQLVVGIWRTPTSSFNGLKEFNQFTLRHVPRPPIALGAIGVLDKLSSGTSVARTGNPKLCRSTRVTSETTAPLGLAVCGI
jgi:hypothetical protein